MANQAQILDLLRRLRAEKGVTIMLITHDMGVVAETCDEVAVFYAGRVVERGSAETVFTQPKHPYTQGLLAALPQSGQRGVPLKIIPGRVPSGFALATGCAFADRCAQVLDVCRTATPPAVTFDHDAQQALCHLYVEDA